MQKKAFRKLYSIIIFFLFVCLLISHSVYAQYYTLLPNIDTDQGLSQSSVLTIHQDQQGFIWLGTRDGLTMYDGYNTQVYKNIIEDSESIGGNIIYDIHSEENNNVWIAHNKGLSYFNRFTRKFTNYTLNYELLCLTVVNNELWASGPNGLLIFDKNNEKLIDASTRYKQLPNTFISEIAKHPSKNEVWLGTAQNKIIIINLDSKNNTYLKVSNEESEHVRIEDILFHENGYTYIATYSHGLYEFDKNNVLQNHWWSKGSDDNYFKINRIREIVKDKNNNIWIGGFEGLSILNTQTKQMEDTRLKYNFNIADNYSVRSLIKDRNGSIWIGTYHNGLIFYDPYLFRFGSRTIYNKDNAAEEIHIVSGFAKALNGSVVAGTESGYLIDYNKDFIETAKTRILNAANVPVVIKNIFFDERNNTLYIGTLNDGVYIRKSGSIQQLPGTQHLGVVNYFSTYENDKLWVLSDKANGINLLNINTNHLINDNLLHTLQKATNKGKGKHIVVDKKDGSYLISSHQSGVHVYNAAAKTLTKIAPNIQDANYVLSHNQQYYVCTNGQGVYVLDNQFKIKNHLTTSNGLQNNTVYSAMATPDNTVWFITLNGISKFDKNKLYNFNASNGLPINEINNASLLYQNNTILIGGKNNFTYFQTDKLYPNAYKPQIVLKDILISNKSITQTKGLQQYNISQLKNLRLKNNQTTLTFLFTGVNYIMPENNTYAYMLEGFEEEWNTSSYRGEAHYSFLPAGNYRLKIKAFNNDGLAGDNIIDLPIKVLPPFWRSLPAILLYLLLMATGLYLWRRNTLKYARLRHNLHLNELEKKRINEMHEIKTKLFTDVSHEIRTPLSLIIAPVEDVLNRNKIETKDRQKLESVKYHSNYLLRLTNQLLKLDSIEKNKEKTTPQPIHLPAYFSSIEAAYKTASETNGVHWLVNTNNTEDITVTADKDNLDTIIINLLSNAFKFTSKGDTITLTAAAQKNKKDNTCSLNITISDTGEGIKQEELPMIFNRYYKSGKNKKTGTGIGLALVKEIVTKVMSGTIDVQSKKNEGTTFIIKFNNLPVSSFSQLNESDLSIENSVEEDTVISTINSAYKDNTARILLVEDNIHLLNYLIEELNQKYSVYPATSAEEAEELLEDNDIDLIVSDIMLPNKDGDVFCAEIKSNIKTSHIPVILLTAVIDENRKIAGLEKGADDYLLKPFNLKELLLRINNILKQRNKWRELYNYQTLNSSHVQPKEKKYNSYDEELLQAIDTYLNKNMNNADLTIEELGHEIGLSRAHLFRKIKKLTGLSPSQYIRNFRLKKAKDILEAENIRIQELAYKVGFNDQNYFSKCFKEAYGVAPTEVRNN